MSGPAVASFRPAVLSILLLGIALPASAQALDRPPTGLASAPKMAQDASRNESWTYAQPPERFLKYGSVMVEPTVLYHGPDAQFDGVDQHDLQGYADIFTRELRSKLGQAAPSAGGSQASTIRLRVTLLGVRKTTGGLATATRVTPLGFATSAIKSALGKTGTFTGSVLCAVELFDGTTNELLLAAVRRRSPDPLDVPATLSTTDTIKAVARDLANEARKRILTLTDGKIGD